MNIFDNLIYFEKLIKGKILGKNIPLTLSISITGNCNFRCSYCYGSFGNKKKDYDISTGEWLSLIEEAAEMGTKSIQILGGEPLLRDDIEEIINKIKGKHIICSMNSNGSLVKKKINVIKKLDYITISLDGIGEANDKNRGKGTYEVIWGGIRTLAENKIPYSLVCVITKNNINEIDALIEVSKGLRTSIEFNLLYEQNNIDNDYASAFQLSSQEIKNILTSINRYKNMGYPVSLSNKSRQYALNWLFDYSQKIVYDDLPAGFKCVPCYMGKFMCHIEYDGSVYPCSQLIGQFPAMNIREVGFKKAWENTRAMQKCKTCYSLCLNEINLLHALDFTVLYNTMKRKLKQMAVR